MVEKTHYLCSNCAVDKYLKFYIENNSDSDEICSICTLENKTINVTEGTIINDLCRFLIRYHYPEYEYNSHWGGEELPLLFYSENYIISNKFEKQNEREFEIENFLYDLFDLNNFESEIDIYCGHYDGERNLFAEAIKNEKSHTWRHYKKELLNKNYYHLEEEAKKTFTRLLEDLKFNLNIRQTFNRARIGYSEKIEEIGFGLNSFSTKIPYSKEQLSSPPILKTTAGRANRQGVAFLYLASNQETAMGEIRPHPGHYVSVGEFQNIENLMLADLRFVDLVKYFNDNKQLQLFKILKDLSEELSIPILPEEKENYLVTQFISDIIRQIGFDGILFNSSVSNGYNLVAFEPSKFAYVDDSSKLLKITSINFECKEVEYETDNFLDFKNEK
ncbi:RES family NAD+ phosphorylase [Flavobacterium degerlachei]|uniref:RES domain-containing protein n=1 Tax=Flavobacterium degerlachei TaxID=229203 RepID=A0A1H3EAM2_9FLAO|nr:RES family NAD+ phosphorylase [Flavobacterium degerlachei]SDX75741.1 RES domain-containing protein [Flavobacterium degerlachei]